MNAENRDTPARTAFLSINRVVGFLFAIAGSWLLLYGIPMGVEGRSLDFPSPRLFPQIAAWIFIGGGAALAIWPGSGRQLPDLREISRYVLVSILLLLMTWLMDRLGFLAGAMAMLAALMVVVFERRWLWIGVTVVAVPLTIWAVFDLLLSRPLP